MKSKILYPAILFAGFILVNIAFIQPFQPPQNKPIKEQTVKYTCPMHPKVVKDRPGNCPKCGMKLVEKKVKIKAAARFTCSR